MRGCRLGRRHCYLPLTHRLHPHNKRRTNLLEEPPSARRLFVYFLSRIRCCKPSRTRGLLSPWDPSEFGYQKNTATEFYKDNLARVAMSEPPVHRKFSRHVDIRRYFVRELVKAGFVKLIPLHTHKMLADALTSSLPSPTFIGHRLVIMGQTTFD